MMKRTEAIRKIKNETQGKIERKIPLKSWKVVIRDETRIVNALKQEEVNKRKLKEERMKAILRNYTVDL